MKKLFGAAKHLLIGAFLGAVFLVLRGPLHLGAPALPYSCPPGHTVVRHWEKGTALSDQPGTLVYHGWTEWAACQDSTTITGG